MHETTQKHALCLHALVYTGKYGKGCEGLTGKRNDPCSTSLCINEDDAVSSSKAVI